jgi:hypothetical protein
MWARRTFLVDVDEKPSALARRRGRDADVESSDRRVDAREPASTLDEICREGARRMLAAALEAEADGYIAEHVGDLDERGHRLVTRNGHARPRMITTGSGSIRIEAPG